MEHHVINGDSAVVLGHFEDNSIDAVVTDPPHGLFFMGSSWDAELPEQRIWDECFRVLKPGGHMFVMSSERLGCVAGLYMSLRKAGFEVDETQILNWVSLTGMPKSVDVGKVADKQAFRDWLDHVGADLTNAERRKAASAAVNGAYGDHDVSGGRKRAMRHHPTEENTRPWEKEGGKPTGSGTVILRRLLASHWPDSPQERRAQWEAVVPGLPAEWDCSRPPGVRVKTGESYSRVSVYGDGAASPTGDGRNCFCVDAPHEVEVSITAPSTPDACALEGRRASVAPLKPFAYPILHAQKPCEGSYLANWRKWGTGPMGVGDARIPFADDADEASAEFGVSAPSGGDLYQGKPTSAAFDGPPKPADPAGRTPSNLLSYGDLLGDLQKYSDIESWTDALDLPPEAADLLEAGLIYAPKPSRVEKDRGLPDDYDAKRNPCAKPVALCAYLTVLATAEGQTVLDPFCGEGPVGVAAALMKRDFVGIELEEDFAETARLRIAEATGAREESKPQEGLFAACK